MMAERKVDGIILVGSVFQSHTVEKLIQQYMPNISIVITNGYIELDNVYSIITDECSAVEKCVTLLYEKKRDKIAFVMDDTTNSILEKKKGYLKAIESLSLSDRKLIVKTDHNIEECKRACHKILELMPDTNAIICGEDITAVTIMNELSRIGKKIPDDIAVIGCNNSKYAELSLPMLTSVNNNQEAVGATAARILRDALEGRKVPKKTIISADIVFRKSTP